MKNKWVKDLTGAKIGRFTVLHLTDKRVKRNAVWLVRCDCGTEKELSNKDLHSTKSCGCLLKEKTTVHGLSNHPIYKIWCGMLNRCNNEENPAYDRYGGRGVKVCERWHDIICFVADMGPSYKDGLEIDRIENDGNYEPGNCKWSTPTEQSNNRRSNKILIYKGQSKTIAEWSRTTGVKYQKIRNRLKKGWPLRFVFDASEFGGVLYDKNFRNKNKIIYIFPATRFVLKATFDEIDAKIDEEDLEFSLAVPGTDHELREAYDRIQVRETFLRKCSGCFPGPEQILVKEIGEILLWLKKEEAQGRDILSAKSWVEANNKKRGYYL